MRGVQYPGEIQKVLNELNQLLDFAEDVSSKIDTATEQIMQQTMYLSGLISILAVGAGLVATIQNALEPSSDRYLLFYAVVGVTLLFAVFSANTLVRAFKKRRSLDVERRILGDLTDMISSLFKSIEDGVSSVDRALLKMRMRRISLSYVRDHETRRHFPVDER